MTTSGIRYYLSNRDSWDKWAVLRPMESRTDHVLVRTDTSAKQSQIFRLEAEDEQGRFIFCRTYRRDELDSMNWRITIRVGEITCDRSSVSPSPSPSPPRQ